MLSDSGALEKQLRGTLNHKDKELQLELMGAMQLELQKRQDFSVLPPQKTDSGTEICPFIKEDAETSLRDLQCEMVEIRSKLMRKDDRIGWLIRDGWQLRDLEDPPTSSGSECF